MKKKWLIAGLICLTSTSVLAACGSKETDTKNEEQQTEQTSLSSTETISTQATTSEASTQASTQASSQKKTASSSAGFATKQYADTETMQFSINGKVYNMGETTLQTLIDDGIPFDENSLNNIENNVNPNGQSSVFKVVLGDYWNLQVSVANFTEEPKAAKDLPITDIYFPLKKDKTQSVVTFPFPEDLTIESLKANAGEPTEERHHDGNKGHYTDTLEYRYESSLYFTRGGYIFDFVDGRFNAVKISYIPR